jgi:hypothetical protein
MTIDTQTIVNWLKQPSTIKAIGGIAAGLGFAWTQADLEKWTAAAVGFSILINGLYDQNPRKSAPKDNTIEDLDATITTEQLIELVRLRKARIAAEKK